MAKPLSLDILKGLIFEDEQSPLVRDPGPKLKGEELKKAVEHYKKWLDAGDIDSRHILFACGYANKTTKKKGGKTLHTIAFQGAAFESAAYRAGAPKIDVSVKASGSGRVGRKPRQVLKGKKGSFAVGKAHAGKLCDVKAEDFYVRLIHDQQHDGRPCLIIVEATKKEYEKQE